MRSRALWVLAVAAIVLLGVLTTLLYLDAAQRMRALGGTTQGLARAFGLFGASAAVLLIGLTAWLLGRTDDAPAVPDQQEHLRRRLAEALAREREFSGHLAHELRTPLTVLHTGLELALRRPMPESEARPHLVELLETVDEMHRLTENLLLMARIDRDADAAELQPVAVRDVVDSLWRRFEHKANDRGLRFDNRVPAEHRIDADRGKLVIVLQNLLANAVSYTEAEGTIAIGVEPGMLLWVWDSGPQLSAEQLPRVFDRMWRADLARTDATKHAGLGLSLARALCLHMGMELAVENVGDGGLRFVISRGAAAGVGAQSSTPSV
ncbi:MAG: HAMP domain-containing histidine kinase [Deltaproteobacteria bacterium]|nr:HAMP domain-containing histidine kinase [Nannocystaceae bacterium]